eukprot:1092751-Amphidinium_carterae.2
MVGAAPRALHDRPAAPSRSTACASPFVHSVCALRSLAVFSMQVLGVSFAPVAPGRAPAVHV